MEIVNLVVGVVAIVLAIASVLISIKLSNDAGRSLDQAKQTLEEVRTTTDKITNAVEQRLQDMINRVVPSQSEQFGMQMMQGLMTGQTDPTVLTNLIELSQKLKEQGAA